KRCGPRGPHRTPSLVADTDDDAVPATQVLEIQVEVRKARVTVRIVVRTARDGCGLAHRCRRHIDHRSRRRTVDGLLHADWRPELEAHDEARRRAHDLEDLHVTMAAMAVLIAVVVAVTAMTVVGECEARRSGQGASQQPCRCTSRAGAKCEHRNLLVRKRRRVPSASADRVTGYSARSGPEPQTRVRRASKSKSDMELRRRS